MFEAKPPGPGEVRALAHQLLSWADKLALAPAEGRMLTEEQLLETVLALATAGRDIARLRAHVPRYRLRELRLGRHARDLHSRGAGPACFARGALGYDPNHTRRQDRIRLYYG